MKITTTELLEEVSIKLKNYSSWCKRDEYSPELKIMEVTSVAKSYYDLKAKASSLPEPTNVASKLFASIDYILARVLACRKRKKETNSEDWPCELRIESSFCLDYQYITEVFSAIIFVEKTDKAESTGCYLLILQLFSNSLAYFDYWFSEKDIPMFVEDENDFTKFSNIHLKLNDAIKQYLNPMVHEKISNKKLMLKEFDNDQAINPTFYKDVIKKKNKKRKRGEAFPNLTDDFEDQPCPVLDGLVQLFNKCAVKPNSVSCLMATIIKILNDMYRLESVHNDQETWPCNIMYGNNLVSLRRYLDRKLGQAESNETKNEAFIQYNLCLFAHSNNYLYLSISDILFVNRVVRRISYRLVPDFISKERREELDKFGNLSHWLSTIYTECLSVLTTDPNSFAFTNFLSSGSASTASSTNCPSPDSENTSQVIGESGSFGSHN